MHQNDHSSLPATTWTSFAMIKSFDTTEASHEITPNTFPETGTATKVLKARYVAPVSTFNRMVPSSNDNSRRGSFAALSLLSATATYASLPSPTPVSAPSSASFALVPSATCFSPAYESMKRMQPPSRVDSPRPELDQDNYSSVPSSLIGSRRASIQVPLWNHNPLGTNSRLAVNPYSLPVNSRHSSSSSPIETLGPVRVVSNRRNGDYVIVLDEKGKPTVRFERRHKSKAPSREGRRNSSNL